MLNREMREALKYREVRETLKLEIDRCRRQLTASGSGPHNLTGLPDGDNRPWLPIVHIPTAAHRLLPSLDVYDNAA